jgi:pSer/pThr/pTyr-binding forkhead associated (FHA) protein
MQDDTAPSDDPGTVLDSYDRIPLHIPAAFQVAERQAAPPIEEALYRSPFQWKAPRILMCDDNSLAEGETFYIRSEQTVIGRKAGDIVVGHDLAMSSSHAEIVRKESRGTHAWVLRDLDSSNGTLVRAQAVTLKAGKTLQLGSKRYRFIDPRSLKDSNEPTDNAGTAVVADMKIAGEESLPALIENGTSDNATSQRYPLRGTHVAIGRPGCGNHIEIDDPCLAPTHAIVTRDENGVWRIKAQASLNGVWVKVDSIRLVDNCFFQCGEQRFRFRL